MVVFSMLELATLILVIINLVLLDRFQKLDARVNQIEAVIIGED